MKIAMTATYGDRRRSKAIIDVSCFAYSHKFFLLAQGSPMAIMMLLASHGTFQMKDLIINFNTRSLAVAFVKQTGMEDASLH